MKKVILGLLLIIVIAIGGSVYYLLSNLDSLVEAAIEKYGSEATQTSVLVDSVKINLSDGAAGITGLTVGNPTGYGFANAFSLGEIRAAIDLQSLQEEPYIINEITVLAPQVFVEINEDNKTNLNELKNKLTAGSTDKPQDTQSQAPAEGSAAEPRLIIRRLTFADGTIQAKVAALKNKEYELKLPSLDMTNLGGSKGATATELASEILKRLTDHASDTVKKDIIDAELNRLKAKAQKKIDEEKSRLQGKVDSKVETKKDDVKNKAKDKLKNLFGN
jgi:cell division septum initiation protein DivIVA